MPLFMVIITQTDKEFKYFSGTVFGLILRLDFEKDADYNYKKEKNDIENLAFQSWGNLNIYTQKMRD